MSDVADRVAAPSRYLTFRGAVTEPDPLEHWPSVPRTEQVSAILATLLAGRSVVVVGEAGVGKTHLVDRALTPVPRQGRPEGAIGAPSPTAPSGPVLRVSASSVTAATPLGMLHPVLAGLADPWRPVEVSSPASGEQLPHRPHVLMVRVDDAHLLDDDAARTLTHLARQGVVRLVVTLRTGAAGRSPWLELWKDQVADRIDLEPFTSAEVDALLTEVLGGPLTLDSANRIWVTTRGNPFLLRELVRTELDEGVLVRTDGVWVGLTGAPPGRRVVDVVQGDVARLDGPTREALDLVALAEPVRASRLVDLVAPGAVEVLLQEGLITVGPGERGEEALSSLVRVAQPMYGEVLRQLVPLDRRRRLFAMVRSARTTMVRPRPQGPANLLRSVVWALECGVRETPERLRDTMVAANALDRPEVTVQIGSVALDEVPLNHPVRPDLLLLRAEAWRLLGEPARARADLAGVGPLLAGTDAERRRVIGLTLAHADLDHYGEDDADAALARIDRAREQTPGVVGEDGHGVLDVARLVHLARSGRFDRSLEPSLEVLRTSERPTVETLRLANPAVFGLAQAGRFDEAVEVAVRACRAAGARCDEATWLTAEVQIAQFVAHLWAGQVPEAVSLLQPEDPSWARINASDAFGNLGLGLAAAAHGRWSDALREHHVASVRYQALDPAGVAAYALAAEAHAAAATGDAVRARQLLERAVATPLRMSAVIESDHRLHLVDARSWLGSPSLRSDAVHLARWSAERGLHRTELEALHRAVLAGHLSGSGHVNDAAVVERMRELAPRLAAPRMQALVAHAEAVLVGDGQLVQIAARELARCGLWLPSARASTVLTRREREIAGLAAGGLSSRAIAERLTVSVRTVDSHLSRVFAKLGIRSRQELGPSLHGEAGEIR